MKKIKIEDMIAGCVYYDLLGENSEPLEFVKITTDTVVFKPLDVKTKYIIWLDGTVCFDFTCDYFYTVTE